MDHNLVGQQLGKYKITRRIARGGMADVYKARSTNLDRDVAIKIMHSHLTHTEQYLTRFKREAQSIARLRHPHIIQLYDFDVEGDIHYMVIEFIKGGTLEQLLQERGVLSVSRSLDILIPLSDALIYAHSHGIIHRDIKPNNIMFTDLQFTHPVLTDFGITKIHNDVSVTEDGQALGTPGYMGPEVGLDQPRDKRSDIYSMGALLYRMLTGKLPFTGKTAYDIFRQQISNPIPDPRQFTDNLPDALVSVIYKSLAQNPEDRYASADEFKKALEDIRADLPQANTAQSLNEPSYTNLRSLITDKTGLVAQIDAPDSEDEAQSETNSSKSLFSLRLFAVLITVGIVIATGLLLSRSLQSTPGTLTPESTQVAAIASETTQSETSTENASDTERPATQVPVTSTVATQSTVLPTDGVAEAVLVPSKTRLPAPTHTLTSAATATLKLSTSTPRPPTATVTPTITASRLPATATPSITPTLIPQRLEMGAEMVGQLAEGETSRSYVFSASPTEAVFITLDRTASDSDLKMEIEDQDGILVAALYPRVTAACIRINPGEQDYLVRVSSENTSIEREFRLETIVASPQQMDCPNISAENDGE